MAACKFKHIAVLYGGCSAERDVSIRSGQAVSKALKAAGLWVDEIDVGRLDRVPAETAGSEVVFIAMHGGAGEDGTVQELLETANRPYTGSGPQACRIAFRKDLAKQVFKGQQILSPEFQVCSKPGDEKDIALEGPWVVKPVAEGSSIGVAFLDNRTELDAHLSVRLGNGEILLVEERISGRELTVGILNDTALPVIEIRSTRSFFDFTAKYTPGHTEYIVPAPIPRETEERLRNLALAAHRAIGLEGFSRADFIWSPSEEPYLLEVNAIPGFTGQSLLPKAAQQAGITFTELCLGILDHASLKHETRRAIRSNKACDAVPGPAR